jgi:hypothetical protein
MVYKWTANTEGVGAIQISHDIFPVAGSYVNIYEFLIYINKK